MVLFFCESYRNLFKTPNQCSFSLHIHCSVCLAWFNEREISRLFTPATFHTFEYWVKNNLNVIIEFGLDWILKTWETFYSLQRQLRKRTDEIMREAQERRKLSDSLITFFFSEAICVRPQNTQTSSAARALKTNYFYLSKSVVCVWFQTTAYICTDSFHKYSREWLLCLRGFIGHRVVAYLHQNTFTHINLVINGLCYGLYTSTHTLCCATISMFIHYAYNLKGYSSGLELP